MMSDCFIGEIRSFAFKFAPQDWAFCDGALLSIQQYQALCAVIGFKFGGDNRNTFGIPDLRQKVVAHPTTTVTPGMVQNVQYGVSSGVASVTLTESQMPAHTHTLHRLNVPGDFTNKSSAPGTGSYLSSYTYQTGPTTFTQLTALEKDGAPNATLHPASIGSAGGGQAHENRQPYLPLNMCICLDGVYPPRPS
ncbi:tail fiber protein [Pokkaliibacter sp. MBI-7]|uniref:phage tail protein n=1 Tax=Pokkaliibacter sp. MBI-7 TaxID=3040600 RepID=UPI002446F32E|nr:tail fiber protein [Pokkaliibacter sp. MBI-7]MDH2435577.1 tail fiber protein [Pokkaliibacter sp. MBI-7]